MKNHPEPTLVIKIDQDTRDLYSHLDFEFFLDKALSPEAKKAGHKFIITEAYHAELRKLMDELKINKQQFLYYLEGYILKSHAGRFLPSLFNLDELHLSGDFLDLNEVGRV